MEVGRTEDWKDGRMEAPPFPIKTLKVDPELERCGPSFWCSWFGVQSLGFGVLYSDF
jgi:hypothetical protein